MVPCHPSLQSTRTRRPGLIRIYTIPPVHHLQCPILWTKTQHADLAAVALFQRTPHLTWQGDASTRHCRQLQQPQETVTQADMLSGRPQQHHLRSKTQAERSTVGSCQWFGSASWPFKAPHQFSGLDKKTMALALGPDSSLT